MNFSKIKNLLSSIFITIAVLILLFIPSSPVLAFWQELKNATLSIPLAIPGVLIGIIVLLSSGFAWISGALLDWVTSPGFLAWQYTQNPVVDIGLNVTKHFVNMGLVVALVFIALAIALRLKEYATQRTLARLIIIALLVNFAPVVVGLIVDASNIAMNYFLVEISKGISGILTGINVESVVNDLFKQFIFGSLSVKFSLLTKGGALIMLNFAIGLAFFLLVFIFLFRYIAIWLLTILSPLAFVAWILPATKKFWDMWWHQLIQWSIIGIPMAFFLYLGMASFGALSSYFRAKMTLPGLEPGISGLLDDIFPYFLVLGIIYLGIVIGLQTSAMGASSAISFAKWSGGKTAKGARWAGRYGTGRFLASERGKKLTEKMKKARIPKMREAKGTMGKIGGAMATATGVRWALRGAQKATFAFTAAEGRKIEEEKKKIEQQFGKDYVSAAATYDSILPINYHKKIAMARYLAEQKGGKGLDKLSEKEIQEIIKLNAKHSPATLEDIVKYKQGLIKDERLKSTIQGAMVGKTREEQLKDEDVRALMKIGISEADAIEKAAFKKAVDALKEKDVESLTDEIRDLPEFQEMTTRFKNWGFIRKIGEEKGLDWMEKIQKTAQEKLGVTEIAKSNPALLRAAYTPSGSMFLGKWKRAKGKGAELNRTEIDKIIQQSRPLTTEEVNKKIGALPSGPKPGAAAMGTPPPRGRRPSGPTPQGKGLGGFIPRTGEEGKRKRNAPRTGKEGKRRK